MNKQEIEKVREIVQWYIEQTGSKNKYRIAWLILENHPNLAVAMIRDRLIELLRDAEAK